MNETGLPILEALDKKYYTMKFVILQLNNSGDYGFKIIKIWFDLCSQPTMRLILNGLFYFLCSKMFNRFQFQ